MIRRPPRSTLDRSSAASDVYKRQVQQEADVGLRRLRRQPPGAGHLADRVPGPDGVAPVSYTHLRAHETVLDLVCRLLLEKKNSISTYDTILQIMTKCNNSLDT